MTLQNRINELFDSHPDKKAIDLARFADVSRATVSNWRSGVTETIKGEYAFAVARFFGVNAEWVQTGKGNKHDPYGNSASLDRNVEPMEIRSYVPLLTWVAAGNWSGVAGTFQPDDAEEWIPCPVKHGPHTFALTIRGDSMYNPGGFPSFREGDTVFIDPDIEPKNRSLVVVRLEDKNEATFKRLLIDGEDRYLEALNPNWPEKIIKLDGRAAICGVAIARLERLM